MTLDKNLVNLVSTSLKQGLFFKKMALFIEAGSMWAIALSLGPKLGEAAALEVTVSAALGSSPTSQPGRKKWDVIADTRDGYKVPRFRNLVVSRSWLAVPRDHSRSRHGNGRAG